MLQDTWSVVAKTPAAMPVLAAAEPGEFPFDVPPHRLWLQPQTDLGARIGCILRCALELAPAAVAIGADSPLLTPADLTEAFARLASGNAVLGPCEDGGFYLLGLPSCPPNLLATIPWSSPLTCEATHSRLTSHGMRVSLLGPRFDIDNLADLQRLHRELQHLPPSVAPQTRAWLDEVEWSAS